MRLLVFWQKLRPWIRRVGFALVWIAVGWMVAFLEGLYGSKALKLKRPIVVDDPRLATALRADGLDNIAVLGVNRQ